MTASNGNLERGMTIRIPKGAMVYSTNPRWDKKIAGKSYCVKIHHFIGEDVNWVGAGGYWTWTHKSNVAIAEASND